MPGGVTSGPGATHGTGPGTDGGGGPAAAAAVQMVGNSGHCRPAAAADGGGARQRQSGRHHHRPLQQAPISPRQILAVSRWSRRSGRWARIRRNVRRQAESPRGHGNGRMGRRPWNPADAARSLAQAGDPRGHRSSRIDRRPSGCDQAATTHNAGRIRGGGSGRGQPLSSGRRRLWAGVACGLWAGCCVGVAGIIALTAVGGIPLWPPPATAPSARDAAQPKSKCSHGGATPGADGEIVSSRLAPAGGSRTAPGGMACSGAGARQTADRA